MLRRCLGVVVCACALVGCEGRARVAASGGAGAEPTRGPEVAVLDLSEGVSEQPVTSLLALSPGNGSWTQLLDAVDTLRQNNQVRGVLVRLGTARIGLAKAAEIAAALETLGHKVPVWCHADEMGNATAYLAAKGCARVWVSPGGSIDAIGIAAQMVYFHKLLADELGLDVDLLQVGKYKGAEEPFTRDGPSDEARASLETTLAGVRAAWIDGIRSGRHGASEAAIEDGPYSAPGAKDRGLIDEVGYFDEARSALEKEAHAARAEVAWGPGSDASDGDPMAELVRAFTGGSGGQAPVAVVVAAGAISTEGEGAFGQGGGIVARHLVSVLSRLEKDDDVKAVVLRIDSPGGSALASDLLWHALMRLRAAKPLVVSVGEMAASGGYYMASAGSVVFADASSIVGSIGVVGGKVAAGHALERVGVFADTVPAKTGDRRAAARAAYESILSPWDDATRRCRAFTGSFSPASPKAAAFRASAWRRPPRAASSRAATASRAASSTSLAVYPTRSPAPAHSRVWRPTPDSRWCARGADFSRSCSKETHRRRAGSRGSGSSRRGRSRRSSCRSWRAWRRSPHTSRSFARCRSR
jgi:protease-4